MGRYVLRRAGQGLFVLWAAFTISFFVLYLLPSDPAALMASGGGEADQVDPRCSTPCAPSTASTGPCSCSTPTRCGTRCGSTSGRRTRPGRPRRSSCSRRSRRRSGSRPRRSSSPSWRAPASRSRARSRARPGCAMRSRRCRRSASPCRRSGWVSSCCSGSPSSSRCSRDRQRGRDQPRAAGDHARRPGERRARPGARPEPARDARRAVRGDGARQGASRARVHFGHALRNAAIPALTVLGVVVGGLLGARSSPRRCSRARAWDGSR